MAYTNTIVEHLLETKAKGKSTLADIVRTKVGEFKNTISQSTIKKYFNDFPAFWKDSRNAIGQSWFHDFMVQQSDQLQQQQMQDTNMINQQATVTEVVGMDVIGEHEKDDNYYGKIGKILVNDYKKWEAKYFNKWGPDLRRYVNYSLYNNVSDRDDLVNKYEIGLWHAIDHSEYSKDSRGKYVCGEPIYTVQYYGIIQISAIYRKGDRKAFDDLERYSHFVYEGVKLMCGVIDSGDDCVGTWTKRIVVDDNPKFPYFSYINIVIEKKVPKEVLDICGSTTEALNMCNLLVNQIFESASRGK